MTKYVMELTYTVLASDGQQYGPVSLAQLTAWINDGRIAPTTQVRRQDQEAWLPAASWAELAGAFGGSTVPAGTTAAIGSASPAPNIPASSGTMPPHSAQAANLAELAKRIKNGANWFYWIAGLTLVNSLMAQFGSEFGFVLGLMGTQVMDFGLINEIGTPGAHVAAGVVDFVAIGLFVVLGIFANKFHRWAFIVGLVIYGGDTLLVLSAQNWLGVIIHAIAMIGMVTGFTSTLRLRRLQSELESVMATGQ